MVLFGQLQGALRCRFAPLRAWLCLCLLMICAASCGAQAPAVPAGLFAVPGGMAVVLSWGGVPTATSYNVKRGTTGGGPYTTIAGPTATTYSDTPPAQNTQYFYVVSAVSAGGESANSAPVAASVPNGSILPDIADSYVTEDHPANNYGTQTALSLQVVSGQTRTLYITFDLTPAGGAISSAKLALYKYSGGGVDTQTVYGVTPGSWTESTLKWSNAPVLTGTPVATLATGTAVQYYMFDVTTYVKQQQQAGATSVSFGITTSGVAKSNYYSKENATNRPYMLATVGAPLPPSGLNAAAGQTKKVTLTWNAVRGATSYSVYRALTSGGQGVGATHAGIAANTYTDVGLGDNITYYYKVTALNSNGESLKSLEASAKTNAPPAITTAAAPNPSTITSANTQLSVAASDDGGAGNLTYTWVTTGSPPAAVTYSAANGTNAGSTVTANFTKAGTYSFKVTVADSGGLSTASTTSTPATVNATLTSIVVTPASAALNLKATRQFTASARNQFGLAISPQPAITWSTAGGGTISAAGLFTAESAIPGNAQSDGPFNVTAASGAVTGTAPVTIQDAVPTVGIAAKASPSPATGTTTMLSVTGADDGGEPALIYTWSVTASPPGSNPIFSVNGTNAAKKPTVTFDRGGSYTFLVTIADPNGLTATSSVTVVVNQTVKTVVVTPATVTVPLGGTQQFTGTALDQFNMGFSSQPAFVWSVVSGGKGTINASTGLYSGGAVAGTATVRATMGAIFGSSAITVTSIAADAPAPGWASGAVLSDPGSAGGPAGPGSSISTVLPSLVAESRPGADIDSYNPLGPDASYERYYRSSLAGSVHANAPGLSAGWTDNYDIAFIATSPIAWSALNLRYPDNGVETVTPNTPGGTPDGTFSHPAGAPYIVTGVPSATIGQWASVTITYADHRQFAFTPAVVSGSNAAYVLTGIRNLVGHRITINRDTAANSSRILSITNDASPAATLLQFTYTGSLLSKIEDLQSVNAAENRQVTYAFTSGNLTDVSQIAVDGASSVLDRWKYAYQQIGTSSYLKSVSAPNPASPGAMTTATITYDTSAHVQKVTDAVNRTRGYTPLTNATTVNVADNLGHTALTWTPRYLAGALQDAGFTDAANNTETRAYADANNPYSSTQTIDRNGHQVNTAYADAFGNPQTVTSPRGDVVTNTYDYSQFGLGQLIGKQTTHVTGATPDAALQATTYSYFGSDSPFNGLLQTVTSPAPGTTSAAPGTVTTTYTYDSTAVAGLPLGNLAMLTVPGPNTAGTTVNVTYNYTTDGAYSQTAAVGQPLTVTDANLHVTHFRYDGRGNKISVIDAVGYETDYYYDVANQLQAVAYPTTSGNAANRAVTYYTYQYPGGPIQNEALYSEGQLAIPTPGAVFPAPAVAPFRKTAYTYTAEGEVSAVADLVGSVGSYTYDAAGRVLKSADGRGNITGYIYDPVGSLKQEQYPAEYAVTHGAPAASGTADTLTYGYDPAQNLTSRIDGRGLTTTCARVDPESLVTQISYSGVPATVTAIGSVNFTYDLFGRRIAMTDGTGSSYVGSSPAGTGGYDDLNNVLLTTRSFTGGPQGQQLSYAYNADGSLATMTLPGSGQVSNPLTVNAGQFAYTYDNGGKMKTLTAPWLPSTFGFNASRTAERFTYGYFNNNWINTSFASLFSTTYGRNTRGFLTQLTNTSRNTTTPYSGNTPSLYNGFSYDAAGNRLGETVTTGGSNTAFSWNRTIGYAYDARDRLIQEMSVPSGSTGAPAAPLTYDEHFNYDLADNLLGFKDASAGGIDFGFNTDNEAVIPAGFSFDGNGSMTAEPAGGLFAGATLTYDPDDRLTAISSPAFSAGYDGDGLRAFKTAPVTGTVYYLYAGAGVPVVEETYNSGAGTTTITAVNAVGADGWRERYRPSVSDFIDYAFDPQGTVVQRALGKSSAQAFNDVCVWDGYGQERSDQSTNTTGDVQYTQFDPVGFGGQYGSYGDWELAQVNSNTTTRLFLRQQPSLLSQRYYDPSTGRFISRDRSENGSANPYGYAVGNPVSRKRPNNGPILDKPSTKPYKKDTRTRSFNNPEKQ